MFKMGLKRFLLSLCLFFCASVIFVSCKDTKVSVSSVGFKESESIIMILGQTYTPNVSVIPSYATNRDYVLSVSSNSDVLKVEGQTIIALKEGVAQLKVVSSENQYLTDMIAVTVLPSKINLSSPADLSFDGSKFSFSPVNYATNYILNINGEEFDLGNSVTFNLSQYQSVVGNAAFDNVLNVKVKTIGDDRISIPSGYGESKTFVKISTPTAKVENNVLIVNEIANVSKYSVTFYDLHNELLNLQLTAEGLGQIEVNLLDYIATFVGGQYFCNVVALNTDYALNAQEVKQSDVLEVAFDVLSAPKNLTVADYVLYWDAVLGAETYTVYNKGEIVAQNLVESFYDFSQSVTTNSDFKFRIVANSSKTTNVVSNFNFSNIFETRVLSAPDGLDANNYVISWNEVDGAVGYNLEILKDGVVQENLILMTNSYSVEKYKNNPGNYVFKVYACGNNVQTLSSVQCGEAGFVIKPKVSNLRVENSCIKWDSDVEDAKFKLVINSPSVESYVDTTLSEKEYNLASINLESGNYTFDIIVLDEENNFNSVKEYGTFYKLSEISKVAISKNTITLTLDANTDDTALKIYNAEDVNKTDITALTQLSKQKYTLDSTILSSGNFVVEAFAYGNSGDVLDADNLVESRVLNIEKLTTPEININEKQVYLVDTPIEGVKYNLFENDVNKGNISSSNYDLSELYAGEYEYLVQAIGNGKEVLDSEKSLTPLKVLKLDTPDLSFNKATLICGLSVEDGIREYIDHFEVLLTLGETEVSSLNLNGDTTEIDFSSDIKDYGQYKITVKTIANTSADYNLIMDAEETFVTATKQSENSTLTLQNERVLITPTGKVSKYTPIVSYKHESEQEYSVLNLPITYDKETASFYFDVYNSDYTAIEPFNLVGKYDLKVKYTHKSEIETNECDLGSIFKLDTAKNIKKNYVIDGTTGFPTESIAFNAVSNCSNYGLRIVVADVSYMINIETTTKKWSDIKSLFGKLSPKLSISSGKSYELQIIAMGDNDNKIITSCPSEIFNIKTVAQPKAEISADNVINFTNCGTAETLYITAYNTSNNKIRANTSLMVVDKKANFALADIYAIKDLEAGVVEAKIIGVNSDGNHFQGSARTIKWVQNATPAPYVESGVLKWQVPSVGVSSYLLTYTIDTTEGENPSYETVKLEVPLGDLQTEQVVDEGSGETVDIANYDLVDIENLTSITVQAIGAGNVITVVDEKEVKTFYYNSKISEAIYLTKLQQPVVKTVDGRLHITLLDDVSYVADVLINGTKIKSYGTSVKKEMIIEPEKLLKYSSSTQIKAENFTISVKAKTVEGKTIINANDLEFSVKGLKLATNLKINTNFNTNNNVIETIDSIEWANNSLNTGLVYGYVVKIVYNEKTYTYNINSEEITKLDFPQEADFGAGIYTISVKTLTKTDGYLNSDYCEELTAQVCEQSTGFKTEDGNIHWEAVEAAGEYLINVYNSNKEKIKSHTTATTQFVLDDSYNAGLYYLEVYATNSTNPNVVTGKPSELIEVLKLPEITKYHIDGGDLYLYTHSLVSKLEISFKLEGSTTTENVTLTLDSYGSNLYDEVLDKNLLPSAAFNSIKNKKWSDLDIATSLTNDDAVDSYLKNRYVKVLAGKNLTNILNLLQGGHIISVTAIGNSAESLFTMTSKTTATTGDLKYDEGITTVQKIATPILEVASRGVVSWDMPISMTYTDCEYDSLQGLLIYEISLSVGSVNHKFLAVDNYVSSLQLPANSQKVIYAEESPVRAHTFVGHIKHQKADGSFIYLNILRDNKNDNMQIDFTKSDFYYAKDSEDLVRVNFTEGGNFIVTIKALGDDTIYLTSNESAPQTLVRYKTLTLDIDNGNIVWENLKKEADNPIYLIKVNDRNGTLDKLVYVYDENTNEPTNLPIYEDGKTMFVPMSYGDKKGVYPTLKYMLDGFDGDLYKVSITTYYSDYTVLSRLQSTESSTYGYIKLGKITPSLESGIIKWNQIKAEGTVVSDYELTITNKTDNLVETVKLSAGDYSVSSGVIYYDIVEKLSSYSFTNGIDYSFEVSALGGNAYINSDISEKYEFGVSDDVTEPYMANGLFSWEGATTDTYQIRIRVKDKDQNVVSTIITTTSGNTYNLPAKLKDINGQDIELTYERYYDMAIKRVGDANNISSYYNSVYNIERLKPVPESSITSKKGVLNWSTITALSNQTIDGLKFALKINGVENKEVLNVTEFDFAGYSSGQQIITITPKHDIFFTGNESNPITFYKLPAVTGISLVGQSNKVQFSPVYVTTTSGKVYAQNYILELYGMDGELIRTYAPEAGEVPEDKWICEIEEDSNFKVRVRAIMTDETGYVINSEWSSYFEFTKPSDVNKSTFKLSEDGLRFEWEGIEGENDNETYTLRYTFTDTSGAVSYKSINVTKGEFVEDAGFDAQNKVYYYKIRTIGTYSAISIMVNRGSAGLSSNRVFLQDENNKNIEYEFNKFAYGDGKSASTAYAISTVEQLKNINLFKDAYYKILNDINLTGITESVVEGTFSGTIDGLNNQLTSLTVSTTKNFGLFETLNKATISNLKINGAVVTITHARGLASENTIEADEFYGGILAGQISSSTLTNVNIIDSKLIINSSDNGQVADLGQFYYGGLAGYISNSTIANCSVDIGYSNADEKQYSTLTFTDTGSSEHVYFGAVCGYLDSSTINGYIDETTKAQVNFYYQTYLSGGVNVAIGAIAGATESSTISNLNVYTDHGATSGIVGFNAGVVGYVDGTANETSISYIKVSGTIGAGVSGGYLGGIYADKDDITTDVIISNCDYSELVGVTK